MGQHISTTVHTTPGENVIPAAHSESEFESEEITSPDLNTAINLGLNAYTGPRRMPFYPRNRSAFKKCSYVFSGIICLKKVIVGTDRCIYHPKIEISDDPETLGVGYNTECPICLESFDAPGQNVGIHTSGCGHKCHLQCMVGMIKLECPTCRAEIINLPTEISRAIDRNSTLDRRSTESLNFSQILSSLRRVGGAHANANPPDLGNIGNIMTALLSSLGNLHMQVNSRAEPSQTSLGGDSHQDVDEVRDRRQTDDDDNDEEEEITENEEDYQFPPLTSGSMEEFRDRYNPRRLNIPVSSVQEMTRQLFPVARQLVEDIMRGSQNNH
jgi:hypothetical protein